MIKQEMLNNVLKTLWVAKINLNEDLPQELIDLDLVPNTNDCFLISENTCNRMSAMFRRPGANEPTRIKPNCGSKFIGSFRDKGSITQVMKRYIPFVKYECNNEIECERLINALQEMRGEDTFYVHTENVVFFQIDIIANPSTGRDNVSALVLQSCIELEGIFEDTVKEFTLEEVVNMNVEEVIQRRKHQHEVLMFDTVERRFVYNFGEVPILLEDFFWQPKHDNSLYCMEKEFSCAYSQFKDGLQTLVPSLYKAMNNSLDYENIHEHCILLGMQLRENNYTNEMIKKQEKIYRTTEEDML